MTKPIALMVEDLPEQAAIQKEGLEKAFPGHEIIHVGTLSEACDLLRDTSRHITCLLTDNGFPVQPGGERLGSKTSSGGAGTKLVHDIRDGIFGAAYRTLPIAWHTAMLRAKKIALATSHDTHCPGMTYCFAKTQTAEGYQEMGLYLALLIEKQKENYGTP